MIYWIRNINQVQNDPILFDIIYNHTVGGKVSITYITGNKKSS